MKIRALRLFIMLLIGLIRRLIGVTSMAATERVISERLCSTKGEASKELVSTKSVLFCRHGGKTQQAQSLLKPPSVPANHKVLILTSID